MQFHKVFEFCAGKLLVVARAIDLATILEVMDSFQDEGFVRDTFPFDPEPGDEGEIEYFFTRAAFGNEHCFCRVYYLAEYDFHEPTIKNCVMTFSDQIDLLIDALGFEQQVNPDAVNSDLVETDELIDPVRLWYNKCWGRNRLPPLHCR